jgi:hypothetical protein
MSIFRLLPLSLLIALSVAPVAAQTTPMKAPSVLPSSDSGVLNMDIGEYSPRRNQVEVPKVWVPTGDAQLLGDTFCLKMRTYKVARDNPDSDATHLVGYSTCQPAARFRTYTIYKEVILPEQP